jgi:hypothetical protein
MRELWCDSFSAAGGALKRGEPKNSPKCLAGELRSYNTMSCWQRLSILASGAYPKPDVHIPSPPEKSIQEESRAPVLPRRGRTESYHSPQSSYSSTAPNKLQFRRHTFPEFTGKTNQQKFQALFRIPPRRSRHSSSTDATMARLTSKIKREIMTIKYQDDSEHKWISSGSIRKLITETEVVAVLQNEKSASWATAEFEKMKEFFLKPARRLFALLVYLEHEELLDHFYHNNFDDDMFPIKLVVTQEESDSDDQSQPGWIVKSTKNQKQIRYSGKGVKDKDIEGICKFWQWQFFVPVFRVDNDNPIEAFDQACQMPFIEELKTGKATETNFSVVRHFVVDRSHLEFSKNEELVRNYFV